MKKDKFKVELNEKRKSLEDGLKDKLVKKKKVEINYMEDKLENKSKSWKRKDGNLKRKSINKSLSFKVKREIY